MDINQSKTVKTFSPRKVFIAIAIGLLATAWLFYQNLGEQKLSDIIQSLANPNWTWFFAALFVLFLRDAAYMYRIRNLTHHELSIKGSIYTIFLWEFASAVTPSVVGGTAVAVFILAKEGIKFGKALAYVMLTAILDNAFFLIAAPIALFATNSEIFAVLGERDIFGIQGVKIEYVFFISYGLIGLYTLLMAYGLLINPRSFKWLLLKITKISILRRWRHAAYEQSSEMVLASKQLKGISTSYWTKAAISTIFIWSARYFMLNCLISAFVTDASLAVQLDIFAKQIILWIVQLLSPTPGGSGFAIYFLKLLFQDDVHSKGFWLSIGLIWRIFTYYAYLVAGAILFPRWLKRVTEIIK